METSKAPFFDRRQRQNLRPGTPEEAKRVHDEREAQRRLMLAQMMMGGQGNAPIPG